MKITKFLSIALVAALASSCNKGGIAKKALTTEIDSVSYAIGMDVARNVGTSFTEFDNDLFIQGFMSVSDSSEVLIDKDAAQGIIRTYMMKKQQEQQAKMEEEAKKKAEETHGDLKAEGEKFLEENMTKDGVVTTASGLQYIVLKEGDGEKPEAASKVKVHYHGTLIDGTVFDSSVDRGEPAQFGVGQVIKGWTEGLQLMSLGAKYKFFIPQELAYGHQQRGAKIKPFSTLIFEVELLEIIK
ncbi:FKBP-type peptidyl-prolyl cis-trans isomerase [Snuella sedimenti]|uniref:Peptidyl-prolyl cis-trans isomerase n=1 Tax=Snuella sedimenti TaxID=2798802 RepID=A0A8J7IQ86_9FLAO|nr:FKBP-type peptidyl-prolyl cis-trans isomerase [Snuella sedimenti]MBJ6369087.1 FKBP-type peptidyl-prolyl cis-trans isomerase [Snuella sedimenti]